MLKLAITLLCIYSVSAKIRYIPGYAGFYDEDNKMIPTYPERFHREEEVFASSTGSGDLWSVKLVDDLDSVKLKRANAKQEQEFDDVVTKEVFLERLGQPGVQTKQNEDSRLTHDEVSALKEEIMRTINKFVMTIRGEPNSYLADKVEDSPTLQLYFHKDRRTLMVVASGRRQWLYPFAPPSRFPDWLYQNHTNAVQEKDELFVKIPFNVKEQLYKTLQRMLNEMLAVQ